MQLNKKSAPEHVQKIIQVDDSLRARMTHSSGCEIKGPHGRFDPPAEKFVRVRPTVFLGNMDLWAESERAQYRVN